MKLRSLLLFLVAACALRTVRAQVLTPPPLAADEVVVTTASGCAVVGRWSPQSQRRNGMWLQAVKANLADLRFDRDCPPGELMMGMAGEGSWAWYYFGRRFGIREASPETPQVWTTWDGLRANLPVDVGTPESFSRRLEEGYVIVSVDDGEMARQVEAGESLDDRKLAKEQRRYIVNVVQGEDDKTYECPTRGDPASCWPIWKQHATPAIERAQRLIAEVRPKVQARREAVVAHLRALDRQP